MAQSSAHPHRRTTLCTEDGREIVPPQLPFFDLAEMPSRASPSRRTLRTPGPMSIDVQLADRGQKVRPLPRIPIPPTPKSAPPAPRLGRNASMRPLPCLPESDSLSISVTPATPLPPPTPTVGSTTHLAPPCPRPGPPRFASLSLKVQTSPDALKPRAFAPSLPSPITPTIPVPPSPRTAQRNRMAKLRRHLGESVQMQLLLDRPDKVDVLAELRHAGKEDGIIVGEVLDLDGTDSDTSSECDGDDAGDYDWGMTRDRVPSIQVAQKWIRERGKNRWTEDNFSKVLQDLRAL
ncbi:hypothetical protein DFH09DRAFT_1129603 [Mycena vulgaris]|nr:hypothetical protein DFH09DRAFT_1129603 [Mycena vulgaris]